jgi:hypothetical protein
MGTPKYIIFNQYLDLPVERIQLENGFEIISKEFDKSAYENNVSFYFSRTRKP